MKKIIRNKKDVYICILFCIAISLIPIFITLLKKDFIYTAFSCKLLAFIVLVSSVFYTYYIFNKKIKDNVIFGITRSETYKKWALTIIISGTYVILLNIVNCILICILKPGVYNDIVDFLVMTIYVTQGFFIYFITNIIVADILTNNKNKEKRKKKVIINCVVCLLFSLYFGFAFFLQIDELAWITIVPDVPMGLIVLLGGIVCFFFERKSYCREEY